MDKQEARDLFRKADALYVAAQYDEALHLLQRLNREFPRQKHIMYSAALCLEQLGRAQESIALCEQLIDRFQDERAELILNRFAGEDRVEAPIISPSGSRKLSIEDRRLIGLLMQAPEHQTPLPAQHGSARVLLAFLIATGGFIYYAPGAGPATGISLSTDGNSLSIGQVIVIFLATSFAANTVAMYTLLSLMQHQRYDSAIDNIFDVMQYAFVIFAGVMLLVGYGWVFAKLLNHGILPG